MVDQLIFRRIFLSNTASLACISYHWLDYSFVDREFEFGTEEFFAEHLLAHLEAFVSSSDSGFYVFCHHIMGVEV